VLTASIDLQVDLSIDNGAHNMHSKTRHSVSLVALMSGLIAMPALADHNSVWGPGFASMPNDVHNTRIEEDPDQEDWTSLVQFGALASTPNRYLDDNATTTGSSADSASTPSRGGGRR
jgi:hypothetical protein